MLTHITEAIVEIACVCALTPHCNKSTGAPELVTQMHDVGSLGLLRQLALRLPVSNCLSKIRLSQGLQLCGVRQFAHA